MHSAINAQCYHRQNCLTNTATLHEHHSYRYMDSSINVAAQLLNLTALYTCAFPLLLLLLLMLCMTVLLTRIALVHLLQLLPLLLYTVIALYDFFNYTFYSFFVHMWFPTAAAIIALHNCCTYPT